MTKKLEAPSADIITPEGTAIWPKLNSPDDYKGKVTFNTKLSFDPDEDGMIGKKAGNIVALGEELRDAFFETVQADLREQISEAKAAKKGAAAKKLQTALDDLVKADVGKPEVDEETGEETGNVVVLVKTNAFVKDKRTGQEREKRIDFFDAKGKKMTADQVPSIGGGSRLKVAATMKAYYMAAHDTVGVTFYLNAVQVIDLVSFGGSRDASAYGFGEEEGYEAEDEAQFSAADDGDTNTDGTNF